MQPIRTRMIPKPQARLRNEIELSPPRGEPAAEYSSCVSAAYASPPRAPPKMGSNINRPLGFLPIGCGAAAVALATEAWQVGHCRSVSIMTVWQLRQRIG